VKRWKVITPVLALICLALAYGFWPRQEPVSIEQVTRGPLKVTVDEEGWARVIDRYVISAPVAGYALRTELDVGDEVKKEDTVMELEPLRPNVLDLRSRAEAEARVEAAEARLNAATEEMQAASAEADYALLELDRIEKLYSSGFVSADDRDRAVAKAHQTAATLRSSRFGIEVARHEKKAALTALLYSRAEPAESVSDRVVISTPVSGRVLKVSHRSEGTVREGDPLVEIGDPRALEVVSDVLSADAVRIMEGAPVLFTRWGGTTPLEGRVRVVEPAGFTKVSALGVEEQRVLVISDIVSPPAMWSRLGDGYRVETSFLIWEADDVLQVPENALFRFQEGWAVFVMERGKAHRRVVRVGRRNGLRAEIQEGLSEGELVITHPDSAIDDGSRVRVRE
jgi:HlyD family secretion protein